MSVYVCARVFQPFLSVISTATRMFHHHGCWYKYSAVHNNNDSKSQLPRWMFNTTLSSFYLAQVFHLTYVQKAATVIPPCVKYFASSFLTEAATAKS